MKKCIIAHKGKEEGSAMLITTIILLVLMVIVATTISISGMQFDIAILNRNTSNTYYLAKSAVEKQVDTMNKAMENQLTKIIKEMNASSDPTKNYIKQLVNNSVTITHNTGKKQIQVNNATLRERLCDELYSYLRTSYKTKTAIYTTGKDPITYTIQSDRIDSGYATEIEITITDEKATGGNYDKTDPKFRVIATATTKKGTDIYDQQKVESIIEVILPTTINNQIHEKYAFKANVPELLRGALISYSDVVVSGAGHLKVDGNMYVSGPQSIGKIAGKEEYPETDQNGGVIALNGGQVKVDGNLYTTNNVMATAGWGVTPYTSGGKITVTQDIIAYTVGIVDDFYKESTNQSPFTDSNQVQNASITVGGNIMVDNDVMIDRWVKGGTITVTDSIFGVNGGSDAYAATNVDPNQSSGVFSQGPSSQIIADRMFVAGQPYITLAEGKKPLKLWESIGEPFNGIASFEGYAEEKDYDQNSNNPKYLDSNSPFKDLIAKDKIKTDFSKSYAVAKVSGIDTSDSDTAKSGVTCVGGLTDQGIATDFFYAAGGSTVPDFDALTKDGDPRGVQTVITNLASYYNGTKDEVFKNIASDKPTNNFNGLRGYMTIMRSIFYTGFISNLPARETFSTALNTGSMPPTATHTWSYATPIEVVNTVSDVDISNFYVDEGSGTYNPYPSIIINTSSNKLTIKAGTTGRKEFKGIIISKGPIEIDGGITIKGTVIVGGPESMPIPGTNDRKNLFTGAHAGIIVKSGEVNIINDLSDTANDFSKIILNLEVKNHALYRSILDMLYMTDYSKTALADIIGKQKLNTKGALKYTDKSILEVSTEGIEVAIKSLKKTQ